MTALAPPTPDAVQRATLRAARSGLIAAARDGNPGGVDFALVTYVGALYATAFSLVTIRTLVEAALDAGLPAAHGRAGRERRAAAIAGWLARADALLGELPPTIPRRPTRLAPEEAAGPDAWDRAPGIR